MTYKLILPFKYTQVPLPGLNAWLEGLRGGQYPQGARLLCRTTPDGAPLGFCCLGVLCEVEKVEYTLEPATHARTPLKQQMRMYKGAGRLFSGTTLPTGMRQSTLLSSLGCLPAGVTVETSTGGVFSTLGGLNDVRMPFADIADILEAVYTHVD